LNQALADAESIVELMVNQGDQSQQDIINEYESQMRKRAGEEVRISRMNTVMLHDWDKIWQSPLLKMRLDRSDELS
jgi:hypothetical protein